MTARSLALLLLLPASLLAADRASVSSAGVLREIGSRGAKGALAHLARNDDVWNAVTDGIAGGDREWLRVADKLLSVAEDPEAYDLEAAVGEALAAAPVAVLEVADGGGEIQLSWVCDETATFEDDPELEERIALLTEREDAVRRVKQPALASTREMCLRKLARARAGLEKELQALTRKIG